MLCMFSAGFGVMYSTGAGVIQLIEIYVSRLLKECLSLINMLLFNCTSTLQSQSSLIFLFK